MIKISVKNIKELANVLYGDNEDYDYLDRRGILDIINEHIETLQKIYNGEIEGSDNYNLGDCINLLEEFKNINFEEYKDIDMKNIYDNGYQMVGNVEMMKKYVIKSMKENNSNGNSDMNDILIDMLEELEYHDNQDIVIIDYDRPMSYGIYFFDKDKDRMEIEK